MGDFQRPHEGFRFIFGGMKLNSRPDALPAGKYAIAVNVRSYEDGTIQSRPGLTQLFNVGAGNYATDLRAYTALGTDNTPRILARGANDNIYLDDSAQVGALAASSSSGASMIPFRPGASPTPYMYIANGADYQKFSAPNASNVVTQQRVGIAEPQAAPEAKLSGVFGSVIYKAHGTPTLTPGGTAGAVTASNRLTDSVIANIPNPIDSSQVTIQVSGGITYQRFMAITPSTLGFPVLITDVFEPLQGSFAIAAIFYFSGSTGRCIVVPVLNNAGDPTASIYVQSSIGTLRRGSLITIGTEVCYVLSVSTGPNGNIAIETSTTNPHTTSDMLSGVPGIQAAASSSLGPPGTTLTSPSDSFQVTMGLGTVTAQASAFFQPPFISGTPAFSMQDDDYFHASIKIDNLANLTEMRILIDVGDGSFTENFYYYTVRQADIIAAIINSVTQLSAAQTVAQRAAIDEENAISADNQGETFSGAQSATGNNQWTELLFSLREFTRVGPDQTLSLQNVNAMQVLFNASGTINVQVNGFFTTGGSQVDVGDVGAPYLYRIRPRSKVTGAVGNPSPATRYGMSPRRNVVLLSLPTSYIDPQADTWDVFRYGGSVTSWRYVGSTPMSTGFFTDDFSDDAVGAGDELEFDNFEPWPVVDVPNNGIASVVTGTVAIIQTTDPDTANYLPGTLIQFGGQNVYTLRARPVNIGGNNYRLDLVENAGSAVNVAYNIQEPLIANAKLPYMWGPDVNGTVFAVGDPLNPGKLYFAKNYAPDAAPDSYNIEITQASEPLLGGEVLDGLSFVASTERWWALYPTPDNPAQRYNFVQQPMERGLGAPFGHCNDGKRIYYWAKDGIRAGSSGGDASLTDADLYDLFPHEGVKGQDVTYNGVTIKAPAYQQAATFRLTYSNGFLYAVYQDSSGNYNLLTLDIKRGAWCSDRYTPAQQPSCAYHVEQQAESFATANPVLLFGQRGGFGQTGFVCEQSPLTTDNGVIMPACVLASAEFDGGDARAPKQWGDFFLDLVPAAAAGVLATPMSLGAQATAPTTIPSGAVRSRLPVSMGGVVVSDFMGLMLQWIDDFSQQSLPTQLFLWQPSFDIQPARTIGWKTFGTSFGLQGFGHIRQIALAWVSTAPITLTITTVDGQAPQALTIPSSGGVYQKQLFPLTANKGQLFIFAAASSAPFQIFEDDIEIHVGAWQRQSAYQIFKSFGGSENAASPI